MARETSRINANTEQDRQQRAILLPFAKPKKNPDYFICGHTFDAKDMFNIVAKTKVDVKKSIIKHIQKAKDQADNIILRMPKWIKRSWIYQAVNGFLNQSKHERIIIVLINNKSIIFKKICQTNKIAWQCRPRNRSNLDRHKSTNNF